MLNITQPMRILLADDDSDDRDFFVDALKMTRFKYILSTVADGAELISYLDDCEIIPHILFLDLNMPKVQGLEALQLVRSKQKYRNMVIAIYSTSSSKQDMENTLASGANCYIVKPHNFVTLRSTIEHVLSMQWQFHLSNMDIANFLVRI